MAGDITNPDFAEPGIGAAPKHKLFTVKNADGIPGWEVTQDAVQLVALAPGARPAESGGGQALRLKGEVPEHVGAVSQTVPTTPGRKTTISWMESPDLAGPAEPGAREQDYTVLIRPVETPRGPGRTKEVFAPAGSAGPAWVRRSVDFTPTGANVTVEFGAGLRGALSPLITGLALTAGDGRTPPPALFGTVTGSPVGAEPGETVTLTFAVGNRTAAPAHGEKATVVFRPLPPLAPAAGAPGTLTFPGRQLIAAEPPAQGAFKVTVPPGTAPGTYQAVADISYDGAPVADGTLTWLVEVVAVRSRADLDETGLSPSR
ncbi:Protein of unknown function [Actinacidiphila paucisporea]|uniref:DUF642 domain-containing protein n=2 Tax=Actinacidiphila paucisporea TaxID=310782 RepID=A0A1M7IRF6_9ACTN|nr:Protein of unknown function [Actinacidiphila paucisporea]